MNKAPFCENCRFFVKGRWPRTDTCSRFVAYRGRGKIVYEWADSVRFNENKCGQDGKLFVSKNPNEKVRLENWKYLLETEE